MSVKIFLLPLLVCTQVVSAQSLPLPDLFRLLELKISAVDSLLLEKGYHLAEQESDTALHMRYYTSLEPHEEEPTWVRSVSVYEVNDGERSGRMIQYRTYHGVDQDRMLSWLLLNQFTTVNRYPFGDEQHSIYSDGRQRILVKTGWGRLPNKKIVPYYVWELGQ